MTTTFSQRISKLAIIPVDRASLLNAIIRFEKSNGQIFNRCVLSLKNICTRRLLLLLGDDHEVYKMYLSPRLIQYVTYDYLTETNNTQYRLTTNDELLFNSELLFCRDCSLNDLGASKCRRRKCLANRLRQVLDKLSLQIISWEKGQRFAILENNDTDDDDDDNTIVFICLKSNNCRYKSSKQRYENYMNYNWIQEQFYLLDLLCILHLNMARE